MLEGEQTIILRQRRRDTSFLQCIAQAQSGMKIKVGIIQAIKLLKTKHHGIFLGIDEHGIFQPFNRMVYK